MVNNLSSATKNRSEKLLKTSNLSYRFLHNELQSAIAKQLPKSNQPLYQEAKLHFSKPGKNLRGITSLRLSNCLNLPNNTSMMWAVATELMHNASLIHDDICDKDIIRRGKTSVWRKYGVNKALCLGDWLVAQAFMAANDAIISIDNGASHLMSEFALVMKVLCTGQAREFERKPVIDWFTYDRIVTEKTSPLLTASVVGPVILARKEDLKEPLSELFTKIGLAYQMINDVANVISTGQQESCFTDLDRAAPNAVVVSYIQLCLNSNQNDFLDWYTSPEFHGTDAWKQIIVSSNALSLTVARIRQLIDEIKADHSDLPNDIGMATEPVMEFLIDAYEAYK